MILILLNILINGYLLFYLVFMASTFSGMIHYFPDGMTVNELAGIGYGLIILITLLGLTQFGEFIARLFLNVRRPVGREVNELSPLLQEVVVRAQETYGTTFKRPKIFIADKKYTNAGAFGKNSIILTRGLLKSANEEELKAVLAQKLGHLYNKDSITLLLFLFSNLVMVFALWCFWLYVFVVNLISGLLGNHTSGLAWQIIQGGIFLILLPGLLLYKSFKWIFHFGMLFFGRRHEYKADKFAASLGYKDGLISFLEKSEALEEPDNSILGTIFATHPAAMKRIGRLED